MTRQTKEFSKLIIAALLIGILSAFLGDTLKTLTEKYESRLFIMAEHHKFYFLLFPLIGLSLIYFLRQYLFNKRENKGIKEIYDSLKTRHNELPVYKIPSHFINGLITIVFGGSTGIEVSTVVASASIGSVAQKNGKIHHIYRKELICAGVAAAVTVLFNSPIAGALFALEVIFKKLHSTAIITIGVAVLTAWGFNYVMDSEPLVIVTIDHWNLYALPYFILLGVLAGLNSVYLTKCVLFFKSKFLKISKAYVRIIAGAMLISICILFFPQLYGDGYHAMRDIFKDPGMVVSNTLLLGIIGILVLKPVVTSLTLASGGDGGVFGPSLFIGAFLGLLLATILNQLFNAQVIPVNFMVIGMGAVLSASLHAPFTALFLICGLINDYTLFVPAFAACMVAKMTAKLILPYTVYNYSAVRVNKIAIFEK
ncbi:MAG: chloride channel protein [Bacteroidota bacterium]